MPRIQIDPELISLIVSDRASTPPVHRRVLHAPAAPSPEAVACAPRLLHGPDHHRHPRGEMPFDMAMEEPEPRIVLVPLDDRVAAGTDADRVLHARRILVQRAA